MQSLCASTKKRRIFNRKIKRAQLRLGRDSLCPAFGLIVLFADNAPRQALLVELNDELGTLDVGRLGQDQIRLVRVLPLYKEHEFTGQDSASDYLLRHESTFLLLLFQLGRSGGAVPGQRPAAALLDLLGAVEVGIGAPLGFLLGFVGFCLGLEGGDQFHTVAVLFGFPSVV